MVVVAAAAYHSGRERLPSRSMSAWANTEVASRRRCSANTPLMPPVKYGRASSASSAPRGARWSRLRKSTCAAAPRRRRRGEISGAGRGTASAAAGEPCKAQLGRAEEVGERIADDRLC